MSSTHNDELSDARKKRVRVLKKMIVGIVIFSILLPTILCILLFVKMNSLNKELDEIKGAVQAFSAEKIQADEDRHAAVSEGEKDTGDAGLRTEPEYTEPDTNAETETEPETESETEAETEAESQSEIASEPETQEPQTTATSEQKLIEEALAEGRKVVYLTFDDGPCANTENLLDAIDKYGVKVTFFVNGFVDYPDSLRRIVNEGHTLALHTYSHDYSKVYGSLDGFKYEISSLQDKIEGITGIRPNIFRFPGGSSNTVSPLPIRIFIDYLDSIGMVYYDWNVSSGDGGGNLLTVDQVYNNVMDGIAGNDVSIVLMHDSTYRMTTYEAVPRIIESLQAMNALILPISEDTVPVHHNVN